MRINANVLSVQETSYGIDVDINYTCPYCKQNITQTIDFYGTPSGAVTVDSHECYECAKYLKLEMYIEGSEFDDEETDCEFLSVYDAALIWLSHGKDADYMFGYSEEELEADIKVNELFETVEYDYPNFHLTMHCFICELVSEDTVLKEHSAAKWLDKAGLDTVDWLPADEGLIEKIELEMQ